MASSSVAASTGHEGTPQREHKTSSLAMRLVYATETRRANRPSSSSKLRGRPDRRALHRGARLEAVGSPETKVFEAGTRRTSSRPVTIRHYGFQWCHLPSLATG